MIRILLVGIFLLIFSIFSIPLFFIEWIVGKISMPAKRKSSLRIVQWAFRVIIFLSGTKTTIIGMENVPEDEPVLFIGNHRSYFDVVISYPLMKRNTGYIAKKEMLKIPVIRTWMKHLYCLFLDRDNIKEGLKTILQAIDYVKNEQVSIVIFPEGTRNKGEGLLDFKEGSFKIAEKTGCKIVPMVCCNNEEIFENHFPWIKKTKTIIEFGEPIDLAQLSKEDRKAIGNYTRNIIQDMYENNLKKLQTL
ncbi:MAG: lysophospholipid acyltransferase family protein [Lachnospiraceae bacterium]